jgi:hypothetical protein
MARPPDAKIFLDRSDYRRRRRIDALRVLPFVGIIAFVLPALLLPLGDMGAFSVSVIYFFAAWGLLIALCALLSPRAGGPRDLPPRPDGDLSETQP